MRHSGALVNASAVESTRSSPRPAPGQRIAQAEALALRRKRRRRSNRRTRRHGWCRTGRSRATVQSNAILMKQLPHGIGRSSRCMNARLYARCHLAYDSFDQWGVELVEVAGCTHYPELRERDRSALTISCPDALIQHYRKNKRVHRRSGSPFEPRHRDLGAPAVSSI